MQVNDAGLPLPGLNQWVAYTDLGKSYHRVTRRTGKIAWETACGLYRSFNPLHTFYLRRDSQRLHNLAPCKICWREELSEDK